MVDKQPAGVYNIPCQQRTARLTKPNIGDLHSGSAVDSDSTCGSSILSSPTRKPQSQLAAVFSGHSAVGSAPRSGRGGRGFKSRCSDQKRPVHICVLVFFSSQRDLKEHGHAVGGVNNSPVGCYLVRGSQPVGMSTGVTTATLLCVCFFVWVGAAGFEAGRLEWPPRALWPYSAENIDYNL